MKRAYRLVHNQARANAIKDCQTAPDGYIVTVSEPTRNLEQNAAQWPILQAFADQLQWPINGRMEWLKPDEWKDVLTSAFDRESVRVAMGLDTMGKGKFSEWLEFLRATAALRDVDVSYRSQPEAA
jgi:hypothetical protein